MAISGEDATLVAPVVERALSGHPLVDETSHGVVLAFPIVSLVMLDDLDRADQALAVATASEQASSSSTAPDTFATPASVTQVKPASRPATTIRLAK